MKLPPYLKKGDKVAITCPAKKLSELPIDAIHLLESWGLEVVLGKTVHGAHHQFSGTDAERAQDLQQFLDDEGIKAIFAARGGYGTIRIIDRLDFSNLAAQPKWIVGFSDITVLHAHLQAQLNLCSLHAQMPLTIPDGSSESLQSLHAALFGETLSYSYESQTQGRNGVGIGELIGGNLAIMRALSGSVSEPNYRGKILFLEDVGEYYYAVDRLLWALKRSGKLAEIAGLIIGGFTGLEDNDPLFGESVADMVLNVTSEYNYPIAFDFPAGHLADNRALILGGEVRLSVAEKKVNLTY
jgi:muramoyltetrapeptide carboxypeptidase